MPRRPTARLFAAVLACSTCVAAAPGAQPIATITAPTGWSRQELFGKFAPGMTSVWNDLAHRSGDFIPKIFVLQEPSQTTSLVESVQQALREFTEAGYRIRESKPQSVCGGKRAGWFISYTKSGAEPLFIEQTRFLADGTLYTATYARLNSQRESPAARKSLSTLCATRNPSRP